MSTRTVNSTADNFDYVDTTETVARITNGSTVTDSIVSPAGDRFGVKVGATLNWFIPDLHGDVAGSWDASEATVVNAIRYDAWGQTLATGSAGGSAVGTGLWKYQGRLDVSPSGLATPLYDMSARFYSPGIGAFTSLDSVMGSAQDPLSMNRFLYAQADPTTLIDPTGHDGFDPFGFVGQVAGNAGDFALGAGEGFVGTFVDAGVGIVSAGAGAVGCAASDSCRRQAVAAAGAGVTAFVRDPVKVTTRAASAAVDIGAKAVGSAVDRVGKAWSSGNFRELGKVTGEIGAAVIPVGGVVAKVGLAAKGITEVANAGRFLRGASELAAAGRVGRVADGLAARLSSGTRASQLHGLLDPIAQRMRTTAVAEGRVGGARVSEVASSGDRLVGRQVREGFRPGEFAARHTPGHAEPSAFSGFLRRWGMRPDRIQSSRPPCARCAQWARDEGIQIVYRPRGSLFAGVAQRLAMWRQRLMR